MRQSARRIRDRWNGVTGICVCQKVAYITVRVATKAAREALARGEGQHRVYPCPNRRRTWHITHTAPGRQKMEQTE